MANENGFESAAWSVDGARIGSNLMRVLAYLAANGSEGVVAPGDLKVHELPVAAGPQVEMDTGAVAIANGSPNVESQDYIAYAPTRSRLDVAPTFATGRSDLVCVRVEDGEFKDWGAIPEGQEGDWPYVVPFIIQNVPANTTAFEQLALDYSAYACARLDLPPNTSTVLDAHIKNLRKVAVQMRETYFARLDVTPRPGGNFSSSVGTDWVKYPLDVANFENIVVPSWATKAIVRANVTGLGLIEGAYSGEFRFQLLGGAPYTEVNTLTTYANEQQEATSRLGYIVSDDISIPAAYRGKTIAGQLEWARRGGVGRWKADADTQITAEITFIGAAA